MTIHEIRASNKEYIQRLEAKVDLYSSIIMQFAVWFVPLIPASLTTVSVANVYPALFHIPVWLAWTLAVISGVGIELLGFRSVELYFNIRHYNNTRSQDEAEGPEGIALFAVILYAAIVLLVVVVLKMVPSLAMYSLIGFSLLGIKVGLLVNIARKYNELIDERMGKMSRHDALEESRKSIEMLENTLQMSRQNIGQLETELKNVQTELNASRQTIKDLEAKLETNHVVPAVDNGQKLSKQDRRQKIVQFLSDNLDGQPSNNLDKSILADFLSVSTKTVDRDLSELMKEGTIDINGHITVVKC